MSLDKTEDTIFEIVYPEGDCLYESTLQFRSTEVLVVQSQLNLHKDIVALKLGKGFKLQPETEPIVQRNKFVYVQTQLYLSILQGLQN